jgi:drug/metabolite transporter (DMT)-like permease
VLITVSCGVLFFSETFTVWTVAGGVLTVVGVAGTVGVASLLTPATR